MKKSAGLVLTVALFSAFSTLVNATYIPDIFGAYNRGVENARYENNQDVYYYYQTQAQPRIYVDVYEPGRRGPVGGNQVSLRKNQNICWQVYPVPNDNQYYISELFNLPQSVRLGVPFFGQNTTEDEIHNGGQITNYTYGYNRKQISKTNSLSSCWVFESARTPKGVYLMSVKVGQVDFGSIKFEIVD